MEKLIEKLANLSWVQVEDDSLIMISRAEKKKVLLTRIRAHTYWVNAGALLALLEKEKP